MELDHILKSLARDPAAPLDVARVALLLAQDEYPDLDVEAYLSELAGMAHEVKGYLRGDLKARLTGLCRYLFHEMGFRGNIQQYHDPRNSYLNQVLDRRTGLPITLSIVAMAVAARAGLEVGGIGLPGHFIARASDGSEAQFFDPFHGGRHLTVEECQQQVEQVIGRPFTAKAADLRPAPLGAIVARLLTNLKGVYLRTEDYPRLIRVTERLRQLAPHDPVQQRDLGTTLLQAGQPGKAIAHLQAYLQSLPNGPDGAAVRQLLQQARGEVARWN